MLVHWHSTIAGVKACLHVLYISFLIFMETKKSLEMLTGLQCVCVRDLMKGFISRDAVGALGGPFGPCRIMTCTAFVLSVDWGAHSPLSTLYLPCNLSRSLYWTRLHLNDVVHHVRVTSRAYQCRGASTRR